MKIVGKQVIDGILNLNGHSACFLLLEKGWLEI